MSRKVFVDILANMNKDGKVMPVSIIWENGRRYDIDRVLDVRRAASLKAGGQGMRYTCKIRGKEVYLFYEVDRWFMEARD